MFRIEFYRSESGFYFWNHLRDPAGHSEHSASRRGTQGTAFYI